MQKKQTCIEPLPPMNMQRNPEFSHYLKTGEGMKQQKELTV